MHSLRSGQTLKGMVKSYNRKGFGFIMCPGTDQDIYFSKESIHPNLQTSDLAGEHIQFEIHVFWDGKMQARNIRALGDVSDFKGSVFGANRDYGAGARAALFSGPRPGIREEEDRSRDWSCSSCQERNFFKRFECFKCKGPKPFEDLPGIAPVVVPVVAMPVVAKRSLSPHAGSRAMREMYKAGLLKPSFENDAASRSRSREKSASRSSSSSSSKTKKKKRKKRSKSSSSESSSSSVEDVPSKSKGTDKDDEGGQSGAKDKEPTNPEIESAKAEALKELMKLKDIEPREVRLKEFRTLLRQWHPDKNPDRQEVATAVFQFLQKGKLLIENN